MKHVIARTALAFFIGCVGVEAAADYAALVNSHSPIAYWRLGESSGTTAVDETGAHSGTYQNAVTLGQIGAISGEADTAADFAGAGNDRVQVPAFDISGSALTMTAWFNADSLGDDRFLSKADGENVQNHFWMLGVNSSTQLKIRLRAGGSTTNLQPTVSGLTTGEWHFIAATYDGATIRVYFNGVEVSSSSKTGGLDAGGGVNIGLGNQPSGAGDRAFDGTLDEVAIFDKTLTAADIDLLYRQGRTLVAHWQMNEASGATVTDGSGNGSDASFNNGTPTWTSGVLDGALQFDGSSDVETDADFGPPAIGSVALWFRSNATPIGNEAFLGVSDNWELGAQADGTIFCDLAGPAAGRFNTGAGALSPGTWQHLVAIYNTVDDTHQLYLDGELVSSGAFTCDDVSAARLTLGSRTGSTQRFNGALDDVRIYNYELTDLEVATLFTAPGALVGHWQLDDAVGATASDSSPIANDGTLNNSPVWVSGKHGGAVEFDGGNEFIEIPHNDSYLADEGTVAFWIRVDTVSGTEGLFSKDSSGFDTGGHLTIDRDGDDVTVRMQSTSSSYTLRASNVVFIGQWHLIAFQWGADGMRLLVDNVEADTDSYAGGLGSASDGSGNYEPIAIGASAWTSDDLSLSGITRFFDGAIDDVRFYSYRLSDSELAGLYTGVEGLVGHWKLDETSGTTAVDSGPSGADGTYENGVSLDQGGPYPGVTAAAFDGVNDLVELPAIDADFSGGLTIAAWIQPDATLEAGQFHEILDLSNGSQVDQILLSYNGAAGLQLFLTDTADGSSLKTIEDNTGFAAGRWVHCVATIDSSGYGKIYRNGKVTKSGFFTSLPTNVSRSTATIGKSSFGDHFGGGLQDVRLYNYELTEAEIAELYGLIGHWKLDENSGVTATDSSGVGADGAYTGGAVPGGSGPYPGSGANAAEFPGDSGDEVTLPTMEYDFSKGVSMAIWYRVDALTGSYTDFFSLSNGSLVDDIWFGLDNSGGLDLFLSDTADGAAYRGLIENTTPVVGQWRHAVASVDANGEATLYHDGQAVKTGFVSLPTAVARSSNGIGETTFGHTAEGLLFDARLYNRSLSAKEVAEIYGLVGWWRMEETSGVTVADSSGMGNHGELSGSAARSKDAKEGSVSLQLDGTEYVKIPGIPVTSESVSIAGWAKLETADTNGSELISLGNHFGLRLDDSYYGTSAFAYNGSDYDFAGTGYAHANSGWRHMVAIFDGDALEIRLYLDGVLRATEPASAQVIFSGLGKNTHLGEHGHGATTHSFVGLMDDVRIYNRAIQREEIRTLYYGEYTPSLRIVKWIEVPNP